MINLIRRFAIPATLMAALAIAIVTTGNTLTVIQNRQANEIAAIRFLMTAAMHGHAHLPTRPVVQPATTLI